MLGDRSAGWEILARSQHDSMDSDQPNTVYFLPSQKHEVTWLRDFSSAMENLEKCKVVCCLLATVAIRQHCRISLQSPLRSHGVGKGATYVPHHVGLPIGCMHA